MTSRECWPDRRSFLKMGAAVAAGYYSPEKEKIRTLLGEHLTAKNLQTEADYFTQPNHASFERTYAKF